MSGLFGKLLGYFANEFIVRQLANSKSFQRFALRFDSFLTNKKQAITKVGEEVVKTSTDVIKEKASTGKVEVGGIDFAKFAVAFRDEIRNDLKNLSKK